MLIALHDPNYIAEVDDVDALKKKQVSFFDKLQALDTEEADAMRVKLGVAKEE